MTHHRRKFGAATSSLQSAGLLLGEMNTSARRKVRFAASAGLLAAALAACTASTQDSDAADTPASIAHSSDWEAVQFAQERGISVDEAAFRLRQQQHVGDFTEHVGALLGEQFGGVWIDIANDDRVTIGITTVPPSRSGVETRSAEPGLTRDKTVANGPSLASDARTERDVEEIVSASARSTDIDDYVVVPVAFSFSALEAANAWLTDQIVRVNAGGDAGLNTRIRTDVNAVELRIPIAAKLSQAQHELVIDARQRFGALLSMTDDAGQPQLDICSHPYCDKPLRGGIRIKASNGNCTGAFIVRGNADSKLYQFTAGHCAQASSDKWWTTFAHDDTDHFIGAPVSPWMYGPNGDLAILKIDNVSGWTPKNWVYVSQGPDTSTSEEYAITAVGSSTVGMRICMSGGTSANTTCGHVKALAATHTNDGITFTNLGAADYCRTDGDSGAPVFASHTGYGIHHGGDAACSAYYSSLRSAEIKMNVRTLTSPP